MPLMVDPLHQQRTIEINRTGWEQLPSLEETGLHVLHVQWTHFPIETAKFQSVILARLGRDRIRHHSGSRTLVKTRDFMTHVVVIDDDRSIGEMIRRSLSKIELNVLTVTKADEGLPLNFWKAFFKCSLKLAMPCSLIDTKSWLLIPAEVL